MIKLPKSKTLSIQSGGRKTAKAYVQLVPGSEGSLFVNGKPASEYFQNNPVYLQNLLTVTDLVKPENSYNAHIIVRGGGLSAQAQSIRLALSKTFVELFPDSRNSFKKPGFLTRDSRIKERRKYGLKKARKASQYSKR